MNRRRGAGAAWRAANMSLWLWPSVAVAVAGALGALLGAQPWGAEPFAEPLFRGDVAAGRAVLTALVGGLVTALSVIFSLAITGLQTVHQQYSPRLLRNFIRDTPTKVTLCVFAGTVAYMLAVLRATPPSDSGEPLPRLAIFVGMLLFLACVGIVAYFAQHITNAIRVHRAMDRVVADTHQALDLAGHAAGGRERVVAGETLPEPLESARVVAAEDTGYVREIDLDRLAEAARSHGASIRLRPMMGDQLIAGTPLAWAWPRDGGRLDADGVAGDVRRAVEIGPDRTQDTDVAYGLRQLVDVAVRAMSPSLNDPYTAVQAIDHMTVLLCRMAREGVPGGVVRDETGAVLVAAPSADLADQVRLAVDQPRRYGAQEPAVAVRLLKLLGDVGVLAPREARDALRSEVERVRAHAEGQASETDDLDPVRDEARAAMASIEGRPPPRGASSVRL